VLTFDRYAELEALQGVVGLARSGDLDIELPGGMSRRVAEQEVIESHLRCGRYLAHPLLRLLLRGTEPAQAQSAPAPPVPAANGPAPNDADLRQFLVGRLAVTVESSGNKLAAEYQDYLGRKGVQLALEACRARVEEAAWRLHQERLLTATLQDDGLYLRSK
jgi:hypothetical protein